jgi:hypothetical protein
MKKPISITVEAENLMWLKGQAAVRTKGNVSELIETLIRDARTGGQMDPAAITSVVGSIDLPDDDALGEADSYVKAMFERSLTRPMLVRETPPKRPARRG